MNEIEEKKKSNPYSQFIKIKKQNSNFYSDYMKYFKEKAKSKKKDNRLVYNEL